MAYFLTVEYVIIEDELIVSKFFIFKKSYSIKDIAKIKGNAGYYLFTAKFPIGVNGIFIKFKNGKRLTIMCLKNYYSFMQKLENIKNT